MECYIQPSSIQIQCKRSADRLLAAPVGQESAAPYFGRQSAYSLSWGAPIPFLHVTCQCNAGADHKWCFHSRASTPTQQGWQAAPLTTRHTSLSKAPLAGPAQMWCTDQTASADALLQHRAPLTASTPPFRGTGKYLQGISQGHQHVYQTKFRSWYRCTHIHIPACTSTITGKQATAGGALTSGLQYSIVPSRLGLDDCCSRSYFSRDRPKSDTLISNLCMHTDDTHDACCRHPSVRTTARSPLLSKSTQTCSLEATL